LRREEKIEVILGGFNNQNSKNKRVKTITRFLYLVPVNSQKIKLKEIKEFVLSYLVYCQICHFG
jgi:hypothetical protein